MRFVTTSVRDLLAVHDSDFTETRSPKPAAAAGRSLN